MLFIKLKEIVKENIEEYDKQKLSLMKMILKTLMHGNIFFQLKEKQNK